MLVRKAMRRLGVSAGGGWFVTWLRAVADPAFADAGFQHWVASFRSVAAKSGISRRNL